MNLPQISLVLATVDRVEQVRKFLHSLTVQSFSDFEVIVVDQNDDDRLGPVLAAFSLPITRVRSARGLSRARNVGLKLCKGRLIGFPDDDCWYGPDVLQTVVSCLSAPGTDFIVGRSADVNGTDSQGRWPRVAQSIDLRNIWRTAISYTIFMRVHVIFEVGQFDERLGVGAGTSWGAGEETDYLIRALKSGRIGRYDPVLTVFHPKTILHYDKNAVKKGASYNRGIGFVLRKHKYPFSTVLEHLSRPFIGFLLAVLKLDFGEARFRLAVFFGRTFGWMNGC